MNRTLIAIAAMAVVVIGVAATPAGSGGPSGDHFVGWGKVAFTDFPNPGETTVETFLVNAHSGAAGEGPRGQFVLQSPFLEGQKRAVGDIVCLDVAGSEATAAAEYSPPIRYLGLPIRYLNLTVRDNGSDDTATGVAWVDRERPPGFSPCEVPFPTFYEVVQGNFVVLDATP